MKTIMTVLLMVSVATASECTLKWLPHTKNNLALVCKVEQQKAVVGMKKKEPINSVVLEKCSREFHEEYKKILTCYIKNYKGNAK